jgi:hypothetical protein
VIQPTLPLHECVDPVAAESAAPADSVAPAESRAAAEPLHSAASAALTETSSLYNLIISSKTSIHK